MWAHIDSSEIRWVLPGLFRPGLVRHMRWSNGPFIQLSNAPMVQWCVVGGLILSSARGSERLGGESPLDPIL